MIIMLPTDSGMIAERHTGIPPDLLQSSRQPLGSGSNYSRPHNIHMDSFRASPAPSPNTVKLAAPRTTSQQPPHYKYDPSAHAASTENVFQYPSIPPSSQQHTSDVMNDTYTPPKATFPRVKFNLSNTKDNVLSKPNQSNDIALDMLDAGPRNAGGTAGKKMVTFQPRVQFDNTHDKTFV